MFCPVSFEGQNWPWFRTTGVDCGVVEARWIIIGGFICYFQMKSALFAESEGKACL